MKKCFCDICGKETKGTTSASFGAYFNKETATPVMLVFNSIQVSGGEPPLDLCEECHHEINVALWGVVSSLWFKYNKGPVK